MQRVLQKLEDPEVQVEPGRVYSNRFNDIYFSSEGPIETRKVHLESAKLLERIRESQEFTIFELGFGSGLNFLVLLQQLQQHKPSARIRYISIEQYPLDVSSIQKALTPYIHELSQLDSLIEAYPPRVHGWHRRFFLNNQVELTVCFENVEAAFMDFFLRDKAGVDAWILDGFTPERNTAMWSPALFELMAKRTKTNGTVSTFSSAGQVRRDLEACGFEVQRVLGEEGSKRHTTVAHLNGSAFKPRKPATSVSIVGAGIAGATAARGLANRGVEVNLLDSKSGIARGASKITTAVQHPRLSAASNQNSLFRIHSYAHSEHVTRAFDAARQVGARHGIDDNTQLKRLKAIDEFYSDRWCQFEEADQTEATTKGLIEGPCCYFPRTAVINCRQLCEELIDHPRIQFTPNQNLDLKNLDQQVPHILALGESMKELEFFEAPLNTELHYGQVDTFSTVGSQNDQPREVLLKNGYLFFVGENEIVSGSTYEFEPWKRGRARWFNERRLRRLGIASELQHVSSYRSTRTIAKDRYPIAGSVAENIWVSLAYGSSATTSAPFAAELLASHILGEIPIGVPSVEEMLSPHRFQKRLKSK